MSKEDIVHSWGEQIPLRGQLIIFKYIFLFHGKFIFQTTLEMHVAT